MTHPDKILWPKKSITKLDYLQYLIKISPYLLLFLKDRNLTVIRYPHGVNSEKFYQKSSPPYAPEFIKTHKIDDINYIVCSNLPTLIWLGNQGAIDLHIPFNTIYSTNASEIVFDLDPPSKSEFTLAIEAALMLKEIFDKLQLISFIKTSGNKGLQVYIPLPENEFSYQQTRRFTEFIAGFIITREPKWFTTERLKKNRGKRLYVDYLQHAYGKTIIAPYSLRGNEDALVSTPLFWEEITHRIKPSQFPMETVIERIDSIGCPFSSFEKIKRKQAFNRVIELLKMQQENLSKG
ncbi:non-homologous end-joining DNA ligase [Alkaliphilus peptidifermentans]|nr:non-homologous end-joining DNA ligase [Alkaliphilus peptidifermentans]